MLGKLTSCSSFLGKKWINTKVFFGDWKIVTNLLTLRHSHPWVLGYWDLWEEVRPLQPLHPHHLSKRRRLLWTHLTWKLNGSVYLLWRHLWTVPKESILYLWNALDITSWGPFKWLNINLLFKNNFNIISFLSLD